MTRVLILEILIFFDDTSRDIELKFGIRMELYYFCVGKNSWYVLIVGSSVVNFFQFLNVKVYEIFIERIGFFHFKMEWDIDLKIGVVLHITFVYLKKNIQNFMTLATSVVIFSLF